MRIEESENFVKELMEDTQNVIHATKTTRSKMYYYTSAQWKWKLYLTVLKKVTEEKLETSTLIRELLKEPEMREHVKEVANMISKVIEEVTKMPDAKRKTQLAIGALGEYEILEEAKDFLSEEFKAEIHIFREDDRKRYDPMQRAKLAKPYRPAIFIE